MSACHALHVLRGSFAIIALRLLLSLLALVLGLVLLLHVLDVGAGVPVGRHLRYGKVPLPTCWHRLCSWAWGCSR